MVVGANWVAFVCVPGCELDYDLQCILVLECVSRCKVRHVSVRCV